MPIEVSIPVTAFAAFLLILARVSALFFALPVIGSRSVPTAFKVGLSVLISLILLPVVPVDPAPLLTGSLWLLALGLGGELLIGLVMGLVVRLLFAAVEVAGELMGFQMGFSVVNVVDPERGVSVPLLGQFHVLLAMLLFLVTNTHHRFLEALWGSYQLLPPLSARSTGALQVGILSLAGDLFRLAVQLGAPIVGVVLLVHLGLGILSRTVPQMNVLIVGFPITIALGFLIMVLSLGIFAHQVVQALEGMGPVLDGLIRSLGGVHG